MNKTLQFLMSGRIKFPELPQHDAQNAHGPFPGNEKFDKNYIWEAQILELSVTDVTSTILNVFNEMKKIMDKELKEIHEMMS